MRWYEQASGKPADRLVVCAVGLDEEGDATLKVWTHAEGLQLWNCELDYGERMEFAHTVLRNGWRLRVDDVL